MIVVKRVIKSDRGEGLAAKEMETKEEEEEVKKILVRRSSSHLYILFSMRV